MEQELEIDLTEFSEQFRKYIQYSKRSIEDEFRAQCKALMTMVIDITPPASGKGTRGKARKMGQNKIAGDLTGGGSSRGKRRVGVFTVLPDETIDWAIESGQSTSSDNVRLWIRKDGTVYGTQQHLFRPNASMSEMREHHKRYFKNGRMSSAGSYERGIGRWKWIDQMVVRESTFKRYLRKQERKVGFYAAGFRPGAEMLGASIASYMKGHSAMGSVSLDLGGDNTLDFSAVNAVGYGTIDRDVQRRIQWAVTMQAAKMERQLPYLLRQHERLVN